jgi:tripartite-type tricarboxylate transporter receptor subunit TctC
MDSARAKFMIETLTNIKNNKVKNLPGGQGQVAAETTTKMKKFLGGLGRKRQGKIIACILNGAPELLTCHLPLDSHGA